MTKSKLTAITAIIAAITAFLLIDDLVTTGLGRWGNLSGGETAWRLAPLTGGAIALALIAARIRRSK